MSNNVGVSNIKEFDPENIWVAAGILFPSALELKIHLEELCPLSPDNVSILCWTLGG
jgi:hypothetical protein